MPARSKNPSDRLPRLFKDIESIFDEKGFSAEQKKRFWNKLMDLISMEIIGTASKDLTEAHARELAAVAHILDTQGNAAQMHAAMEHLLEDTITGQNQDAVFTAAAENVLSEFLQKMR